VVGVVAAGLTMAFVPAGPARYSLQDGQAVALEQTLPENPLNDIAFRLQHPDTEVFRVDGGAEVDRWPLVVLDGFDGVNWTATAPYRRLGTELRPGPALTGKVHRESARLTVAGTGGPWLPSQTWPASVEGVAPKVAERYGSLLLEGTDGTAQYTLSWWQPEVDAEALSGAPVDESAPGGFGEVGEVPEGVEELAQQVMRGLRPSFRTALLLEDYLRTNYRAAVGQNLPTGHGWPQLTDFLLSGKRGTSEQFAAAYVALARIVGIPARLAVGFRMPAGGVGAGGAGGTRPDAAARAAGSA
jgi:hypothetical protein